MSGNNFSVTAVGEEKPHEYTHTPHNYLLPAQPQDPSAWISLKKGQRVNLGVEHSIHFGTPGGAQR